VGYEDRKKETGEWKKEGKFENAAIWKFENADRINLCAYVKNLCTYVLDF